METIRFSKQINSLFSRATFRQFHPRTNSSPVQVDTYGTQQPIALLKLLLEKGGMYDRGKDLFLKYLKDLGYIASMGKAGGGRNDVSTGVG